MAKHDKKGRSKQPDGQYVGLPYAMIKSPAWRNLSGTAIRVLLELHCTFYGSNNGDLWLSLDQAKERLRIGKTTAGRAFDELIEKGFLKVTKRGNFIRRNATTYALTFKPTGAPPRSEPRSDDWKQWSEPPRAKRPRQPWGASKRRHKSESFRHNSENTVLNGDRKKDSSVLNRDRIEKNTVLNEDRRHNSRS
jgi:hypothetical protein